MIASALAGPSVSSVTAARYAESTPPLNPMATRPRAVSQAVSARSFDSAVILGNVADPSRGATSASMFPHVFFLAFQLWSDELMRSRLTRSLRSPALIAALMAGGGIATTATAQLGISERAVPGTYAITNARIV